MHLKQSWIFRLSFFLSFAAVGFAMESSCFSSDDKLSETAQAVEEFKMEPLSRPEGVSKQEQAILEAKQRLQENFKALDSSIAVEFGLFEKREDDIDWKELAKRLGFQSPGSRGLSYDRLTPDYIRWFSGAESKFPVYEDMIYGRYDEAIVTCRKALREYWPFVSADSESEGTAGGHPLLMGATGNLRYYLFIYARAYEFKEMFGDAMSLYLLLYSGNDEEFKWINTRLLLSQAKKGNGDLISCFRLYQQLAEYKNVDFDPIINELEQWGELNDSSAVFPDIVSPLKSRYHEVKYYSDARKLYVLRDRCAQAINPKLHFTLDDRPRGDKGALKPYRLPLLSRASYLAFLDFLEADYRLYLKSLNGDDPNEEIQAGIEVARQLARLPY